MLKYNLSLLWSSAAPPPPQCAMQRREATEGKEPRRRQLRINASADVASRTGEEEAPPTTIISIMPIF
jgi:hypothetical protein